MLDSWLMCWIVVACDLVFVVVAFVVVRVVAHVVSSASPVPARGTASQGEERRIPTQHIMVVVCVGVLSASPVPARRTMSQGGERRIPTQHTLVVGGVGVIVGRTVAAVIRPAIVIVVAVVLIGCGCLTGVQITKMHIISA